MAKKGIIPTLEIVFLGITLFHSLSNLTFTPTLASPPACKPMKPTGWKRAPSLRLGECDGRYQGDQRPAIKSIRPGYNFLKSGLGQGLTVKVPQLVSNKSITRH
jgi:hypothetical protein